MIVCDHRPQANILDDFSKDHPEVAQVEVWIVLVFESDRQSMDQSTLSTPVGGSVSCLEWSTYHSRVWKNMEKHKGVLFEALR